jgi:exodeoxyribonuclease V alpha subunit
MITIKGVLTRLTYQNPENHYTVCRIKVPKIAESITVVGHLAGICEGESLAVSGQWVSHPRFGDQFQAETYRVILPATIAGIRQYLGNGMIKGISQALADRIVDTFQDQTFEIIENEPEKLRQVTGIGKAKQQMIERAWNQHHRVRKVMQFLQEHQVGVLNAGEILKTYGSQALEVLTTDPYQVAKQIPGFGFSGADTIARSRGIDPDDPRRLEAALICQLLDHEKKGHVYALKPELFTACARLTGVGPDRFDPPLADLVSAGEVVRKGENQIYLTRLYKAEAGIASRIQALLSMPRPSLPMDEPQIMETVLNRLAVQLSDEQMAVVLGALNHRIVVITGGPGTGKTTLVQALCAVFRQLRLKCVLGAPTGRAARRLAQVTGQTAATLHKLLEYDHQTLGFERSFAKPLDLDIFVVDEASMVDTLLMHHLLEALPATASLILVGDTFQLPSVGPGNVLSDIIASDQVQIFALTRIFRQARKSPIVRHAHRIREGKMPRIKKEDASGLSEFYFIENHHPEKVAQTITTLCAHRIPSAFPHIEEIQVLTPMHRGDAGTISLNLKLQQALNPKGQGIENRGMVFRPGDKVMHLKNNYEKEVFNGDIGTVREVSGSRGSLTVDYDGRIVPYELLELDQLTLAYAISVHKSQGSEYAAVVIALTMAHRPLLQRNLLYTAMTRGKHLVILVGSSQAFETAFNNDKTACRLSGLKDRLMAL